MFGCSRRRRYPIVDVYLSRRVVRCVSFGPRRNLSMSFARLVGIPLASMVAGLGLPAAAQAQQVPLAGLIGKIIQESTFNSATPNAAGVIVNHQGHFLVGEALQLSARQMNVELGEQLLS